MSSGRNAPVKDFGRLYPELRREEQGKFPRDLAARRSLTYLSSQEREAVVRWGERGSP
jgi:hypothetical protein